MSEHKNSDYSNIYKNNQESSNFTNYQKKILLSNINLAKKNFNLKKTQSPNKISNLKLTKFKINSDNCSNSQYILSNDTNLKFNNIKLIRNSRSQNLLNSVKSTKKHYLNSVDYSKDKNTERIFLLKIDEVNKTLEESENIFRYNQKILKKN